MVVGAPSTQQSTNLLQEIRPPTNRQPSGIHMLTQSMQACPPCTTSNPTTQINTCIQQPSESGDQHPPLRCKMAVCNAPVWQLLLQTHSDRLRLRAPTKTRHTGQIMRKHSQHCEKHACCVAVGTLIMSQGKLTCHNSQSPPPPNE